MVGPIGRNQARDAYVTHSQQPRETRQVGNRPVDGTTRQMPGVDDDSVYVSESIRTIQEAIEAVKQSPDARSQRVAELRQLLQSGQYAVAPEQVAAKMLGLPDDPNAQ